MKKYILNKGFFEDMFYTLSKYDISPRRCENIEIREDDYFDFIKEQTDKFVALMKKSMKLIKELSFEEFKELYGEDDSGNAICPNCGSIIHKDDWDYENRAHRKHHKFLLCRGTVYKLSPMLSYYYPLFCYYCSINYKKSQVNF